jgi:hypothetical protein
MNAITTEEVSTRSAVNLLGIFAMAALAYVPCDLLHELGHAAATLLPVGVKALSISTIGLTSMGSSAVVAVAGPLVNFVLALALLFALAPSLSPAARYFAWLFGSVSLLNATAYLPYSAALGTGDWAVVFNALAPPQYWRPVIGLVGLLCYAGSVYASVVVMRRLRSSGVVAEANVERYCAGSYWMGAAVITAGAIFNPVSPWFILTSGAASGLGAMAGLLLVPVLLRRTEPTGIVPAEESLRIGWPWVMAGIGATVVFIGVFGPGLRLA